jgi:hypothetical protein
VPGETRQSIIDEEQLRLLSLGFMVSGGVSAFFSLIGIFYAFMGIVMSTALSRIPQTSANSAQTPPPAFVGWIFIGIGLMFFVFAVGMTAARFRAAWCIKHRARDLLVHRFGTRLGHAVVLSNAHRLKPQGTCSRTQRNPTTMFRTLGFKM